MTAPAPAERDVRCHAVGCPRTSARRIYEGTVRHRRFAPTLREFTPKLFLAYLDVDAPRPARPAAALVGAPPGAPVHIRPATLDGTSRPLGAAVRDLAGTGSGAGRRGLSISSRYAPSAGRSTRSPSTTLDPRRSGARRSRARGDHLWGQRHWYVLDAQGNMTTTTAKAMHVSPFLPMDLDYRITWTVPDAELNLRIEVERDHTPVFDAELALRRTAVNRGRRHRAGVRAT